MSTHQAPILNIAELMATHGGPSLLEALAIDDGYMHEVDGSLFFCMDQDDFVLNSGFVRPITLIKHA